MQLIDRLFVTGLMRGGDGRIIGAVGIHSRTGEFHVIKARATIVATNAITFRSGFVRDITGTGTLLAYRPAPRCATPSSATCGRARRSSISRASPSRSRRARIGSTPRARRSCATTSRNGRDEADVPRIARAMAMENNKGNAPLYLDMSAIPEHMRDYFIQSKVKWMDNFFRKLGEEAQDRHVRQDAVLRAQPDDQDGHPHRPGLPLRRAGPAGGRARAGRLRQPFRRLPHRAVRRQRLDRRPLGDRGPRPPAAAAARRRRGAGAARRDACAARSRGGRRSRTASCATCRP